MSKPKYESRVRFWTDDMSVEYNGHVDKAIQVMFSHMSKDRQEVVLSHLQVIMQENTDEQSK